MSTKYFLGCSNRYLHSTDHGEPEERIWIVTRPVSYVLWKILAGRNGYEKKCLSDRKKLGHLPPRLRGVGQGEVPGRRRKAGRKQFSTLWPFPLLNRSEWIEAESWGMRIFVLVRSCKWIPRILSIYATSSLYDPVSKCKGRERLTKFQLFTLQDSFKLAPPSWSFSFNYRAWISLGYTPRLKAGRLLSFRCSLLDLISLW